MCTKFLYLINQRKYSVGQLEKVYAHVRLDTGALASKKFNKSQITCTGSSQWKQFSSCRVTTVRTDSLS